MLINVRFIRLESIEGGGGGRGRMEITDYFGIRWGGASLLPVLPIVYETSKEPKVLALVKSTVYCYKR